MCVINIKKYITLLLFYIVVYILPLQHISAQEGRE